MGAAPDIRLDAHGIRHVISSDRVQLYWGMGYCHAIDRGLQMLVVRILGRGQGSQHLQSSREMLGFDRFFRRLNLGGKGDPAPRELSPLAAEYARAYCDGINAGFSKTLPWELRILGYRPDPWTLDDTYLLSRMMGYVALAQSQEDIERLLIESIQAGVKRELLGELFPGNLEMLDEELIREVKLPGRLYPPGDSAPPVPVGLGGSNSWVLSGSKTASGKPILANDPHLQVNRLPNVWYEIVLESSSEYMLGSTVAGLPGIVVGRTADLAWGVTYSFADTVDSWIEECRPGEYRREDRGWGPFRTRREVISRKKKPPVTLDFYENEHGVLHGAPDEEGYRLATRWSCARSGPGSIEALAGLWDAKEVQEGMEFLGGVETSWNWVLADRRGNIGHQMSGLIPRRATGWSGFVPMAGWKPGNDWQGFVDPADLPRRLNPGEGYIVTANQDLTAWGNVGPTNMPVPPYRADRIRDLISPAGRVSVSDQCHVQYDLRSLQAESLMEVLRPILPDSPQGEILRRWNCSYEADSRGAFLFEKVYQQLLIEVFGRGGLGVEVMEYFTRETGLLAAFYGHFDRVLLSGNSSWLSGRKRDKVFRRALEVALKVEPRPLAEAQNILLGHLLFSGKLPRFLGFDRGPVSVPGGRATVFQVQFCRSAGQTVNVAPSLHFVTDLASDEVHTNLCGGPSDRRFSGRYVSDVENWLNGRFKALRPFAFYRDERGPGDPAGK